MRSLWFPLTVALILVLWVVTRFVLAPPAGPPMPTKVTDAAERALYLTPGGLYTPADIAANGGQTVSERYPSFRANHDADPRPGDPVCPVTRTKADSRCTWVVGGQAYSFCCPPCVDEFVRLAKDEPGRVRPPAEYVHPAGR